MKNATGDIIQRCTADVERIKTFFQEQFVSVFRIIVLIVLSLACMVAMNWRLSALDGYTLVSNSDAHSPTNLAREANIFDCGLSYADMRQALAHPDTAGFGGTLEFSRKRANTIWMAIAYAKYAYRRRKPTSLAAYAPSAGRRLPSACCIALMNWRIARKEAARKPPGIMKA